MNIYDIFYFLFLVVEYDKNDMIFNECVGIIFACHQNATNKIDIFSGEIMEDYGCNTVSILFRLFLCRWHNLE